VGFLKELQLWPSRFWVASHHELLSCKKDTLGRSVPAQGLKRWPKLAFYMVYRIRCKLGLLDLFRACGLHWFSRSPRLFPRCHRCRILHINI
jgi:hypothetical protein